MHSALLSCVTAMYGRLRRRRDGGGLWRAARQPQQPHHRCCHMPTDLTSKSRNHRQPEAFPHIPASWLLLCAEYKLLIFSLQKASLSCGSYSTAATATTSTMLSWILAPENHAFLNNQNTLMLQLLRLHEPHRRRRTTVCWARFE